MYENLLREATQQYGIDIREKKMPPKIKGLYSDGVIWINRDLPTVAEKACVFAEELGHYHTSVGDILDQSKLANRKQEKRARSWAYERLIPLQRIIEAFHAGVRDRHELADFLGVTETFLQAALGRYKEKYGLHKTLGRYTIRFEPLGILEMLED